MRATKFSATELRFLKSGRDLSRRKLYKQFVKKFNRYDLSEEALYFHAKKKGFRKKLGRPNERPIGFEVIQSGYVLVKTGQHTRMGSLPGWIPKHVMLWEALHGVIPNGHVLKCIDGDRTNTDPSNWESVPCGVVGRLSKRGFRDAPAELKPTIITVAKLEHALNEAKRG